MAQLLIFSTTRNGRLTMHHLTQILLSRSSHWLRIQERIMAKDQSLWHAGTYSI